MEQYREKLKIQNYIMGIGCLVLAVFACLAIGSELGWFPILHPLTGNDHWQSAWFGFVTGASCGIFALLFVGLIRNALALKDEKKLKKLYVKNHDERTIQILTQARNTAMQLLLWIGLIAAVVAGYFSVTVSVTILICTFICSITSLLLAVFYNKKM